MATAKLEKVNGLLGEGQAAQDLADQVIAHKTAMRAKQVAEVNDRYTGALQAYNNGELEDARKQLEMARLVIDYDAYQTDFGANAGNVKRLLKEVERTIAREADARERSKYEDAYRRLKAEEERDPGSSHRDDSCHDGRSLRGLRTSGLRSVRARCAERSGALAFPSATRRTWSRCRVRHVTPTGASLTTRSVVSRSSTGRAKFATPRSPGLRSIQFPSQGKWDEITRMRMKDDAVNEALEDSELTRVLKNKLATETVTWSFEDMTLNEVISYIRDTQNVNIFASKNTFGEKGEEPVNFKVNDLNFGNALKLALEPLECTYTYRNNRHPGGG